MKAVIFDIQRNSFVDGPGIRTTVFFKGCNLRCKWCHNPESQSLKPQIMFYADKCTGCGRCRGITAADTDFLCEILKKCKESGIHTAVDTAGNVPWEQFEKILPFTDLFLYDVKAFSEELHKDGTGVSNKLILENLKRLSGRAEIIIRVPIIGGYNNNIDELKDIAEFLKGIEFSKVELLPYHSLGEHKYDALNMRREKFSVPDEMEMVEYKKLF